MMPIFASHRLDWSSAIGLFILNFGQLDWQLLVFLESRIPGDELASIKGKHFQDRVARVKALVECGSYSDEQRQAFANLFQRIDSIRELRNHIAHGHILSRLLDDMKTWKVTLSLPKDLDANYTPETRHLEFAELTKALSELTAVIEEFQMLSGDWKSESWDVVTS